MVIPNFDSYPEFFAWFAARAKERHLRGNPCDLDALEDSGWIPDIQPVSETSEISVLLAFRRVNEAFWALIGFNTTEAPGREVSRWKQPVVIAMSGLGRYVWRALKDPTQPSVDELVRTKQIDPKTLFDGRVVIFVDQLLGDVLVRVIAEPGNWGYGADEGENTHALLAPSLQFSEANLANHERAMRGEKDPNGNPYKPIPLADLLDPLVKEVPWVTAHGEGGFFLYRRVRITWVPVDADARAKLESTVHQMGDAGKDFCWVSRHVLAHARDQSLTNAHLLSGMGLLIVP